jgi:hypothetical protein
MIKHKNDDTCSIGVNLSSGNVYINGEPMMVWHVPLASSQPPAEQRKAETVAYLLAYHAADYSRMPLAELKELLERRRHEIHANRA